MKEFMMIFIGANYQALQLSPEESQLQMGKWFDWIGKLEAKGIYQGGKALTSAGKAISGPDQVITDGPYAEMKELVGGYFIVKAESLDEAVSLAKDYPDFHLGGSVEIREVMVFD